MSPCPRPRCSGVSCGGRLADCVEHLLCSHSFRLCTADESVATWWVHPPASSRIGPPRLAPTQHPLALGPAVSVGCETGGAVWQPGSDPGQLASLSPLRQLHPAPWLPDAVHVCLSQNWRRRRACEHRHEKTGQIDEIDSHGPQSLPCRSELCRRVWPRHQPNEVARITTHSDRGPGFIMA